MIPKKNLVSKEKIMARPTIVAIPKIASYLTNFFPVINGSSIEMKKAVLAITAKATLTFETFIAQKKVIQWKAIMKPTRMNLNIRFLSNLISFLLIKTKRKIERTAIPILHQTSGTGSILINLPQIPV